MTENVDWLILVQLGVWLRCFFFFFFFYSTLCVLAIIVLTQIRDFFLYESLHLKACG